MKSRFDLKHNIAWLEPETADDIWLLNKMLAKGDLITGKTTRSLIVARGEERVKVGRRAVTLKILLEKAEMEGQKLRLSGKIIEGPEDMAKGWHTIEVNTGDNIKVEKVWKAWEIDRIKAAARKPEPVLVCILDETDADVWLVTDQAKHIAEIKGRTGKREGKTDQQFLGNVASVLEQNVKNINTVVIAGPGFAKDNLKAWIKEKKMLQSKNVIYESVAHTFQPGLQELLRRGIFKKILKASRISEETEVVERFLAEVSKGGLAEYGYVEVEKKVAAGAVEILLISEEKTREFESIIEMAEKMHTKIMIISSEHENGRKLLHLGGIGAILRYKV